jgi:peptide/nickel transport system ATP-binding protein
MDRAPTTALLNIDRLSVVIGHGAREARIISELSFSLEAGELVGVVGESGCGKTMTGLAILGLLPPRARVTGRILFEGVDLCTMPKRAIEMVRGRRIAMIFQDAASALDPVFTVGQQIAETIRAHFQTSAKEARERAVEALARVGIPSPRARFDDYPHQFSGGMRQRVMIAIALSCEPRLLIADEPTTALDVTVQAQIIDLLLERASETGTALLLITHDLGLVSQSCARILTMYAGELVEDGLTDDVLSQPGHPYTAGLLQSLPCLSPAKAQLPSIPGRVASPTEHGAGCRFAPRCGHASALCALSQPIVSSAQRRIRCCRHSELNLSGVPA